MEISIFLYWNLKDHLILHKKPLLKIFSETNSLEDIRVFCNRTEQNSKVLIR